MIDEAIEIVRQVASMEGRTDAQTYWFGKARDLIARQGAAPPAASADPDALTGCADDQGMFAQPDMDAPSADDLREAIRNAKIAATTKYGIAWHSLEEISQFELVLSFLRTPPTAAPAGEPVAWVSPGQLADHQDRIIGSGGAYLPVRKTRDGNFTMPLYAAPSGEGRRG
jgi:hypothetical protein